MIFRKKKKYPPDLDKLFISFKPDADLKTKKEDAETPFDYKKLILQSAINVSNRINDAMLVEERKKSKARSRVLIYLSILLGISIIFIFGIIILKGFCGLQIDNILIVGVFTYIIVNIFTILTILIKYLSENKLLDTFAGVTQRLLEFLVRDNQCEMKENSEETRAIESKTENKNLPGN